jgi:hypothetical protein
MSCSYTEAATKLKNAAHGAINKRLGINRMHTDAHGDIINIVTKKSGHQQGAWILTWDIGIRFPNSRAAIAIYDQQRAQHNNRDPKAERHLTCTGHVSPILIPTRHSNEASGDASLHILHVACVAFRGRDGANLFQLFRDSLSTTYENILALDTVEVFQMHEDYFSALNETVEIAGNQTTVELDAGT